MVNYVVVCQDTNLLRDYNRAAQFIIYFVNWKTGIYYVRAEHKLKRQQSAAQIFAFDTKVNIFSAAALYKES